jgi:hypothetical protein
MVSTLTRLSRKEQNMSFQKSPGLEDFQEIIPEKAQELSTVQKAIRVLIGFFALVTIGLAMLNFWKSDLAGPLRGTGSVRGVALDENSQPLNGSIFVVGTQLTAKTNPDGSFELNNIPAGKRAIVVADAVSGREFPIEIRIGQVSELGTVQLQSTATP